MSCQESHSDFFFLPGPLRLFFKKENKRKEKEKEQKESRAGEEMKSERRPDSTVSGVQVCMLRDQR